MKKSGHGKKRSILPEQLDKFRSQQSLTMEELAAKADISIRSVERAAAGEAISYATIRLLAEGLGVDRERLFKKDHIEAAPEQLLDDLIVAVRDHSRRLLDHIHRLNKRGEPSSNLVANARTAIEKCKRQIDGAVPIGNLVMFLNSKLPMFCGETWDSFFGRARTLLAQFLSMSCDALQAGNLESCKEEIEACRIRAIEFLKTRRLQVQQERSGHLSSPRHHSERLTKELALEEDHPGNESAKQRATTDRPSAKHKGNDPEVPRF